MRKVVIVGIGSRGDIAPLTGIGVRLQQAGHQVVVAAPALFADLVSGCGLEFRQLDADLGIDADLSDVNPLRALAAFWAPSGVRATGEGVLAALRDEPADALLLSPLAELAGHPLAEAKGIPSVGVRLQPLSATAEYPPAVLGAWSAGAGGNRLAAGAGAWVVDRLYSGVVGEFRRQLGLPKMSTRALRRRRTEAEWPVLHGYSTTVVPRPVDWRPNLEVVGYWWPARPKAWRPPAELVAFLDAGPAPVFVGFGSLVNTERQAARLSDIVRRALRAAGVRGVIQAGWAGLEAVDEGISTIGEVPHDWLFPRMAAVVHHCGAGTTAAGLRAGVPAIAVPAMGDQPFWARRLTELGVSVATIPHRKLTTDRLVSAIHTAVTDPSLQDNARQLADRIAVEDGAGQALTILETLLDTVDEIP
ncbi:glycosyltransferase [Nocardia iowensis]|uniref:Glycosyltransferase n=1 Tax=Nocardia iowensis TaxID=204891 RepID=A0ABX8RGG4_NOCIO|nr:glycosyltransferase [Nocardia iowensis]QXN88431.1 glycosyltransferase [Nocardia iowensis]